MEESKPALGETTAQVVDPPSSAQGPPPPPPPPPSVSALPPKSKKRPLDGNLQIENSKYFKMRLVLKDLRPHFLEVLRTPDFQHCKASEEIREKMKLMIELYQQMTGETAKQDNTPKPHSTKQDNTPQPHSTSKGNENNQIPQKEKQEAKPSETQSSQAGNVSEKQEAGDGVMTGTYVVGGSAFGWNFITFGGTETVYYGVTKETYRSSHPISEGQ